MRFQISNDSACWPLELAQIVKKATDGDVVVVNSPSRAELAKRAASRMDKDIIVEVKEET